MAFEGYQQPIILKIVGISIIITIIIIYNYEKALSVEYPVLAYKDYLNDQVSHVRTSRSSAYVEFENGRKIHLWAQNLQYENEGYLNLSSLISPGDQIVKRKLSDTILVEHKGREYMYINKKTIGIK